MTIAPKYIWKRAIVDWLRLVSSFPAFAPSSPIQYIDPRYAGIRTCLGQVPSMRPHDRDVSEHSEANNNIHNLITLSQRRDQLFCKRHKLMSIHTSTEKYSTTGTRAGTRYVWDADYRCNRSKSYNFFSTTIHKRSNVGETL